MINFFTLAWDPSNPTQAETAKRLIHKIEDNKNDYEEVFQTDGVIAYAQAPSPHNVFRLTDQSGVVLGRLYRKTASPDDDATVRSFSDAESRRIVESRGDELTDRFWGSYVSILPAPSARLLIGRDCSAVQLCYTTWIDGVYLAFSNFDSLPLLDEVNKDINWDYLATTAAYGISPLIETGLNHVEQLAAGQSAAINLRTQAIEKRRSWKPEDFTEDPINDMEAARRILHDTVLSVVKAQCGDFGSSNIQLMLSGGLDSSILLAALRKFRPADTIYAKHMNSLENDVSEEQYAQAMADAYGVELEVENKQSDDENNYVTDPRPPWPIPIDRSMASDNNEEIQQLRARLKAQNIKAFFKGQGGDQIFFKRPQLAPLFDYQKKNALDPKFYEILLNTARLTEISVWKLLNILRQGNPDVITIPPQQNIFLSKEFSEGLAPADPYAEHPWFQGDARFSFGKHNQLTQYTFFNNYAQRWTPSAPDIGPNVAPFICQPLMETMLRIPTHIILAGGRNRGLARDAFKAELVPEVYNREAKSFFSKYFFNMVIERMGLIKDTLYEGVLVREGFLDRHALDANLNEDSIKTKLIGSLILNCLKYEKWARALA